MKKIILISIWSLLMSTVALADFDLVTIKGKVSEEIPLTEEEYEFLKDSTATELWPMIVIGGSYGNSSAPVNFNPYFDNTYRTPTFGLNVATGGYMALGQKLNDQSFYEEYTCRRVRR